MYKTPPPPPPLGHTSRCTTHSPLGHASRRTRCSLQKTSLSKQGTSSRLPTKDRCSRVESSVRYRFGSPFFSKRLWFVDTVLWLCPSLSTETLKWLSSLPILKQESFWRWQCSDRYIISLFPHLHTPSPLPPPPSPPLLPVPNKPFCGR